MQLMTSYIVTIALPQCVLRINERLLRRHELTINRLENIEKKNLRRFIKEHTRLRVPVISALHC